MTGVILALNAGSSSIKFSLFVPRHAALNALLRSDLIELATSSS